MRVKSVLPKIRLPQSDEELTKTPSWKNGNKDQGELLHDLFMYRKCEKIVHIEIDLNLMEETSVVCIETNHDTHDLVPVMMMMTPKKTHVSHRKSPVVIIFNGKALVVTITVLGIKIA